MWQAYLAITKPKHAIILDKRTHWYKLQESDYNQYINIDRQHFLRFSFGKGESPRFESHQDRYKSLTYIWYTQDVDIHKE